jgi:uncharacterized protein YodC (DUF2158 family)
VLEGVTTRDDRWKLEQERWRADPFTSGTVVRHRASGVAMVVTGKAGHPRDRTCAWMDGNRRFSEDFDLCELERVESAPQSDDRTNASPDATVT